MIIMMKKPTMVDITGKDIVYREAEAYGRIRLRKETIDAIANKQIEKGDPISIAALAGIQAAKLTPQLLPLCHPINITKVDVECSIEDEMHIGCRSFVRAIAKTGVEMEALTAVTVALVTIWDVVKKYEKDNSGQYPETMIEEIRVVKKFKKEV